MGGGGCEEMPNDPLANSLWGSDGGCASKTDGRTPDLYPCDSKVRRRSGHPIANAPTIEPPWLSGSLPVLAAASLAQNVKSYY